MRCGKKNNIDKVQGRNCHACSAKKAMIEILSHIDNLVNALGRTRSENAKASREGDKKNILS